MADWFAASVTRAVKDDVPAVVGVPEMAPFDASVSPAGKIPAETAQLYGGVPPVAPRLAEYGWPTLPLASDVVVIVGAPAAMVICRSRVADWFAASVTRAVKDDVPAVVGVPLMAPFDASVSPAGRDPADTAQL
ncbi:MAG TPA: hypothetical protein VER03_21640 [Bryobacteraceae bacterium]|nr:hypothetical protein [Bryobacteraceae bacterium]